MYEYVDGCTVSIVYNRMAPDMNTPQRAMYGFLNLDDATKFMEMATRIHPKPDHIEFRYMKECFRKDMI